MKKTKIIATIGPASKDETVIRELIINGVNVIRINMTHATHEFLGNIVKKVKKIDKELNTYTGIMIDLNGPNIITGAFEGGSAYFSLGDKIRIYDEELIGDSTKLSVNYDNFIKEVKTNTIIKLNDGLIELKVIEKGSNYLLCEVTTGGFIENYKSVTVVGSNLNVPFLSKKDKDDIKYADKLEVDFLALSYVSSSEDILCVNDYLIELENDRMSLVSKIESENAIDDIDNIIKNSDGIIISRVNLGLSIPPERIPMIQKSIINKCHTEGKFSIISNENLSVVDSVVKPTRAEVSDLATAILDGVDSVLLSNSTTIGKLPIETVREITKIIEMSEKDTNYYELLDKSIRTELLDITGVIATSVVESASRIKAKLIVTPTMSGYTAKKISRFRPTCPILALSPDEKTVKTLNIYYGVYPILIGKIKTFEEMTELIKSKLEVFNLNETDKYIITGGYPFNLVKHTNFMKIEEI